MSYASVVQFREYLEQLPANSAKPGTDARAQDVLNRATSIIDTVLGYSFGTAAVGSQTVYGDGTDYLLLPAHVAGSVTAVTTLANYTVPDYIESGDYLIVSRDSIVGRQGSEYSLYAHGYRYPLSGGWLVGVPYTVAATFGYSAVPADIVEACLEIAVRIWRGKDNAFSDVVGVEGGGAVGYERAIPALARTILDKRLANTNVGVW